MRIMCEILSVCFLWVGGFACEAIFITPPDPGDHSNSCHSFVSLPES
jgi:hypothetical protein